MSATRHAGWTGLLAAALAHDINNLAQGLASAQRLTRPGAGHDLDVAEWAAFVDADVDRLRTLGIRVRALAMAAESRAMSALLDDACTAALAEVDRPDGRVQRAPSLAPGVRVRGTPAAVTAAIASLIEHAIGASPTGASIDLAVRSADGAVIVEVAAPAASMSTTSPIERARLDALLDTALRDRRGDFTLVLPGAVADALGGAVYCSWDAARGLVLELLLAAA